MLLFIWHHDETTAMTSYDDHTMSDRIKVSFTRKSQNVLDHCQVQASYGGSVFQIVRPDNIHTRWIASALCSLKGGRQLWRHNCPTPSSHVDEDAAGPWRPVCPRAIVERCPRDVKADGRRHRFPKEWLWMLACPGATHRIAIAYRWWPPPQTFPKNRNAVQGLCCPGYRRCPGEAVGRPFPCRW